MTRSKDDRLKLGLTEWLAMATFLGSLIYAGMRFGSLETKVEGLVDQFKTFQTQLYGEPKKPTQGK